MDFSEAIIGGFELAFSVFASLFANLITFENLKAIVPYLAIVGLLVVIGFFFGLITEAIKSFFQTGIGQLVLLISFGVVVANVWIF